MKPETSLQVLFTSNSLLRVLAICISFVTNTWLARELGEDFGSYGTLVYLIGLLTIPAGCGLNQSLTPYIAGKKFKGHMDCSSGTVLYALVVSEVFSFLVILAAIPIKLSFYPSIDNQAFTLALLTVPLIAFLQNCRAILQGMELPLRASLIETLLLPSGVLLFLAASHFLCGLEVSLRLAFAASFMSSCLACITISLLLGRKFPMPRIKRQSQIEELRQMLHKSLPFCIGQSVFAINSRVPLLVLAASASETECGAYYTAAMLAGYVSFPLVTINPMISGRAANLYAQSASLKLRQLFQRSAHLCFLLSAPFAGVLLIFGRSALEFFNHLFVVGYPVLVILVISQLANTGAGSVGVLVNMTGNAHIATKVAASSTTIGICICLVLIPSFGLDGAAIGQATGLIIFNVSLVLFSIFRLGLNPSIMRSPWVCIR